MGGLLEVDRCPSPRRHSAEERPWLTHPRVLFGIGKAANIFGGQIGDPIIPIYCDREKEIHMVMPQAVKEQLGSNRGDILEANVEGAKLTHTPKEVLDRLPAIKADRRKLSKQIRDQAPEWLKASWEDAKRKGVDKVTMKEINAEIAAYRREPARKKNIKQSTR